MLPEAPLTYICTIYINKMFHQKLKVMRKMLITCSILMTSILAYSQITIKHEAKAKKAIMKYDSTSNFLSPELIDLYIGQSLYIRPKNIDSRDYGYSDFYKAPNGHRLDKSTYYYPNRKYGTEHDSLAGKTFLVIDVITKNVDGTDKRMIKMVNNLDTVYYEYPIFEGYDNMVPYLVVGYVEKLKRSHVGRYYYIKKQPDETWTDFETGNQVKIISGSKWKCTDVILDGEYFTYLRCILKNEKRETISEDVERVSGEISFVKKERGDRLRKKFGLSFDKALARTVSIGMPEELVLIARGKPGKIKESSKSGEQWIYEDGEYYYFKEGKLTGWN